MNLQVILCKHVFHKRAPTARRTEQMQLLAARATMQNISIRILPDSIATHDGFKGSFTILSFPEPEDPDTTHLTHALGSTTTNNKDHIATAKHRFSTLTTHSLSEADSIALIEQFAAST